MPLAKDGLLQTDPFSGMELTPYLIQQQGIYGASDYCIRDREDYGSLDKANEYVKNHSPSTSPCSSSSSACTSSNGPGPLRAGTGHYKADIEEEEEEGAARQYSQLINFKAGYCRAADASVNNDLMNVVTGNAGQLLNFQEGKECSIWEGNDNLGSEGILYWISHQSNGKQQNQLENHRDSEVEPFGLLFSKAKVAVEDATIDPESSCLHKRPHMMGKELQGVKRHCSGGGTLLKKSKPKSSSSKDPQSIAAKNRRERISERLKTLQDLVPNGSKVDLVTMLEKAISYVKFLQLQVKVLATDEFWPVQGGKAPDISQVREAIDAILSSQTDRNPSSK